MSYTFYVQMSFFCQFYSRQLLAILIEVCQFYNNCAIGHSTHRLIFISNSYLFATQYLQRKWLHFVVKCVIVEHECWLVLEDLVHNYSRLARLFSRVAGNEDVDCDKKRVRWTWKKRKKSCNFLCLVRVLFVSFF